MALGKRSKPITAVAMWFLWMLAVVEMSPRTALAEEEVDEIKIPVDTKPFVVVIEDEVYPSVNFLNRNLSRERHPLCRSKERYEGNTDDQGTAVLRDLPLTNQFISVSHDDYQVPKTEGRKDRNIKVVFDRPEQQTVRVTLEGRPKP